MEQKRIARAIVVAVGAALAGLGATYGVAIYQDWSWDRQARRSLREQTEMALGPDRPPSPESFAPVDAVPRPPLVSGLQIVSPDAVRRQHVLGEEFVLGVVVEGEARAYPINAMTGPEREVFNDVLGGRSIAATW